jgi:hypothetical protein
MADPNQQAADKLKKETEAAQKAQAENAEKTWQNLHEGKIQPPTENDMGPMTKKPVKKMAKGGMTASKRADGCCTKGKTKGRIV